MNENHKPTTNLSVDLNAQVRDLKYE